MSKVVYEVKQNEAIEIFLNEDEVMTYYALDNQNKKRIFHLASNAKLEYYELNTKPLESDFEVLLEGDGATLEAKTLTIGDTKKYNYIQNVIHKEKHTNSNITNFAIGLNDSNVIFNTTGKIMKGMSGSDCRQLSKGIIISDNSKITSEPILLIDEYDVFAAHGASIGKMSDEEMFYLMSRGLTKDEALTLIVNGLIEPFLEKLGEEKHQKYEDIISEIIER